MQPPCSCLCPEVSGHLLTAGIDFLPSLLSPCAPVLGTAVTSQCWGLGDQSLSPEKSQSWQWILPPATGLCWGCHPTALGSDISSLMHVLREFLTLSKLVSEVKWWVGQEAAHGDKPGTVRHAGQWGEGDLGQTKNLAVLKGGIGTKGRGCCDCKHREMASAIILTAEKFKM